MKSNTSFKVWPFGDFMFNKGQIQATELNKVDDVHSHLQRYSSHFDLFDHIHFHSNVTAIHRNQSTNQWDVILNDNRDTYASFDRLVLALGATTDPSFPSNLNIKELEDNFDGTLCHSKDIKHVSVDDIKGKRMLVIGNSVSSFDSTEHFSECGAEIVYNVYREPRMIINFWRTDGSGYSIDHHLMRKGGLLDFDLTQYALKLDDYGFVSPDVNDENLKIGICKRFGTLCADGQVKGIRGEIKSVNGKDVTLKSGQVLEDMDVIMFATGYQIERAYQRLLGDSIVKRFYRPETKSKRLLLYLLTFIAGFNTDNVAIVGGNTFSGSMGLEMQSRLVAAVWSQGIKLPNEQEQEDWIRSRMVDFDPFWFGAFIPAQSYVNELAEVIGCAPKREDFVEGFEHVFDALETTGIFPVQFRISEPGFSAAQRKASIQALSRFVNTEFRD